MYGFIIRYSCLEVIREMIEKEEKEILAMTDLVSGSLRDDPFYCSEPVGIVFYFVLVYSLMINGIDSYPSRSMYCKALRNNQSHMAYSASLVIKEDQVAGFCFTDEINVFTFFQLLAGVAG